MILWEFTKNYLKVQTTNIGINQGFAVDLSQIKPLWTERVTNVFEEATLHNYLP